MSTHFDLAIIGTGSGNSIVDDRFADQRVAILEKGTFGGTCLNVGCIPTKMFVYPADLGAVRGARRPARRRDPLRPGPLARDPRPDLRPHRPDLRRRPRAGAPTRTRTSRCSRGTPASSTHTPSTPGTGETITADQVVIAAGARPVVPDIEGLDDVGFHTSDTVMRLDELPERLLILGGGFVAAEFAHVFGSFGTRVTIVNRSVRRCCAPRTTRSPRAFTEIARQRWDVRLDTKVAQGRAARRRDPRPARRTARTVDADVVLVAAGRRSNADGLDLDRAGVVDRRGRRRRRRRAPAHQRRRHLGARRRRQPLPAQARLEPRGAGRPAQPAAPRRPGRVPSTTSCRARCSPTPRSPASGSPSGRPSSGGCGTWWPRQRYGDTAYGWAMEDTTGFAKVLADPDTGLILGAHFLGPQASNLIQPIVRRCPSGRPRTTWRAGQYWIHPALMEVTENLLLALPDPH